MKRTITIYMKPKEASIDLDSTALVMIDMQRDFLDPRGALGGVLGNDVSKLHRAIGPCQKLLA